MATQRSATVLTKLLSKWTSVDWHREKEEATWTLRLLGVSWWKYIRRKRLLQRKLIPQKKGEGWFRALKRKSRVLFVCLFNSERQVNGLLGCYWENEHECQSITRLVHVVWACSVRSLNAYFGDEKSERVVFPFFIFSPKRLAEVEKPNTAAGDLARLSNNRFRKRGQQNTQDPVVFLKKSVFTWDFVSALGIWCRLLY